MRVEVHLPGLVAEALGGTRVVSVEAGTIAEALRAIRETYPRLAVHVFDDAGELRRHVLVFHNENSTRWLDSLDVPLKPGDRFQIVQAISGG